MTVYAVFREGVYRHACGGIFSTAEKAGQVAHSLAAGDGDNWHDYQVIPFELDEVCPVDVRDPESHFSPAIHEPDPIAKFRKS